jgi:hypothetical protein
VAGVADWSVEMKEIDGPVQLIPAALLTHLIVM